MQMIQIHPQPAAACRTALIVLGLCLARCALHAQANPFQAGAASVNITPPLGIPLAGYYHARGADGVADELQAKALVFRDGQTQAAFVACDLISLPRDTVLEARQLIQQQSGIPASNVMISATHTHTGPVMTRGSARDESDGGSGAASREYTSALPRLLARAVHDAQARLAPARVSFAREHEHRMSYVRRYWMKDGTVGWNPGKLNPNTIRPVSSIDPEVGVVYVESTARQPISTFVNFAMHTDTTGGTRLSADMPGALARCLAAYKGPDMVTLFANGTCGNINHTNVRWPERQSGTNEANRLGAILAAAVFKAYMDLEPAADCTLRARHEILALPLAPIRQEDVTAAREIISRTPSAPFLDRVRAYKTLDVQRRNGQPIEAEVQVVALGGELAWVALPGEIFVELGLSIKAASPFRQTHIAELANGSVGYVPNRSAYAEGNYEVVSARVGEGAGEMLVQSAVRMLADLHSESAAAGVWATAR
ncbi:MAG TPA: hypothetical protein P5555_08960 [Candidatus Paceibacterota bacterium]|nr:hypothetical protein [Verrucomicrobiota bacterium]HRZ45304.1 hypothetical protein [Candidatus Paceibacterota bacterium]HRZ93549.1 hypothetical protein [Candidatus Paceibacterota bacterium]